jgi:hypothetical protein
VGSASVTLDRVSLESRAGGIGGNGNEGQGGQLGGRDGTSNLGADPGTNNGDTQSFACAGGRGGNGGKGGNAAGGAGGVSALIVNTTSASVVRTGTAAQSDALGTGGLGGTGFGSAPGGAEALECDRFDPTTWACAAGN